MALDRPLAAAQTGQQIPPGVKYAGRRLRVYRELAGHSVRSLSEEAGVPDSTIKTWEMNDGRLKPRKHSEQVKKIAEVLSVAENVIWFGTEQAQSSVETDVSDVTEDVSVFLTRLVTRRDVPDDLKTEAKDILRAVLHFD